jgi:para-aminobenzoate synthetase component 1
LAIGVYSELTGSYQNGFKKLERYQQQTNDYIFGYLSYDLKNDTEALESNNYDGLEFPDLYFFQPIKLIFIKENKIEFHYLTEFEYEIETDFETINNTSTLPLKKPETIEIKQRISKQIYTEKLQKVLKHIKQGDSYEVNFCMEFYAEQARINPLKVYQNLNKISTPPFGVFFKNKQHFLLSASPERFVRKQGDIIISQPIKGTIKRSSDKDEDALLIDELKNNPKERSENIMIVDLVRNDLSKTATKGSVKVEELCQVYSFKQVHQLISTIRSQVKKEVSPVALIKSLFPMGSMTGAPKISTMKIIEKLEENKRSVYSGTVGYFTPEGDFDFNVVIRSILYNSEKNYVSYSVGGAITAKSIIEKEYEECLLKARAMKQVLS